MITSLTNTELKRPPCVDINPYLNGVLTSPYPFFKILRHTAPVVFLSPFNKDRTLPTKKHDGRKLKKHLEYPRSPRKELVLFGTMQIEGADIHPKRKAFRTTEPTLGSSKTLAR